MTAFHVILLMDNKSYLKINEGAHKLILSINIYILVINCKKYLYFSNVMKLIAKKITVLLWAPLKKVRYMFSGV